MFGEGGSQVARGKGFSRSEECIGDRVFIVVLVFLLEEEGWMGVFGEYKVLEQCGGGWRRVSKKIDEQG